MVGRNEVPATYAAESSEFEQKKKQTLSLQKEYTYTITKLQAVTWNIFCSLMLLQSTKTNKTLS